VLPGGGRVWGASPRPAISAPSRSCTAQHSTGGGPRGGGTVCSAVLNGTPSCPSIFPRARYGWLICASRFGHN
jgi:hypothetical protein